MRCSQSSYLLCLILVAPRGGLRQHAVRPHVRLIPGSSAKARSDTRRPIEYGPSQRTSR